MRIFADITVMNFLSQEVGALAVEVFGQDNVYTAIKVKDIMADIETIGYDQAHFSNKLKKTVRGHEFEG